VDWPPAEPRAGASAREEEESRQAASGLDATPLLNWITELLFFI
jgi:hypothetical protein